MTQLAPWRSVISSALHRNRNLPQSRYFQLATIRKDGKPANRTVVFRGFLDHTNQLQIITDLRSAKIEQIEYCQWGEICWYFSKTREQFRFTGQLTLINADYPDPILQQARYLVWQQLSNAARLQFAWPAPEKPRIDNIEAFSPPLPSKDEPVFNFCLVLFNPERVDHLELQGEPQNRSIYWLNTSKTWTKERVNP